MTIIMLLEDDQDKAGALVEAAIDLSRVTSAEICCLDVSASACGTPIANVLGKRTDGPVPAADEKCLLCLGRTTEQCRPALEQANLILSRSAAALERAITQGYGPVLLVPSSQKHFRLAGTAVIILDDSPSIARNAQRLRPILQAASKIEIVTMRGAAPSDAETLVARLFRHDHAPHDGPAISVAVARDADIRGECERLGADWCLAGVTRADGIVGLTPSASGLLNDPPCPLLLCV